MKGMRIERPVAALFATLGCIVGPVGTGGTSLAAQELAFADRAPRFLQASATEAAKPVEIEPASSLLLRQVVSLRLDRPTVGSLLDDISRQTGLTFFYAKDIVAPDRPVTLRADSIDVATALTGILMDSGVDVLLTRGKQVALVRKRESAFQDGTIVGRVTDASMGEGISSVNVVIAETQQNATTDAEGVYRFEGVPAGSYTLTATRLGYIQARQRVAVVADEEVSVDFALGAAPPGLEEIVVTGSRIRRAEVEGPSPVTILIREDLERTGRATVAEAMAQLPQNFAPPMQNEAFVVPLSRVDLRGLGADNTLVLVNGRRVANSGAGPSGITTFVDLNSIPLTAVERIEVMTDGGSAIYGSDAVAGVVNIILRKDFRGMEVSVDYGLTVEGGASERRVGFTAGAAKKGLRGLLTGEYFSRDRLAPTDRAFSRSTDQRARGGRDFRSTLSNPGNVFSIDGQNLPGLNAPSAGIPTGQDGRNLTSADFAATAGELNLEDLTSLIDLIAPSERLGLSGRLDWELGSELTVFTEATVARTTNEPRTFPASVIFATVPAQNPFNPFGEDVEVLWLATELGRRRSDSETDNLRALLGLGGRLGRERAWDWEMSLGYSRDEFDVPGSLRFDSGVIASLLNRSDPTTALNVFGDGAGANSPAVLDELARTSFRQSINGVGDALSWSGYLSGVLAEWGGRDLSAAAGAEYRRESLDHTSQTVLPEGGSAIFDSAIGDRGVVAGFVEFTVPVFDVDHPRPGAQSLELQLAGRWEYYSDFGETFNPRLAVRWQPLGFLALRGSASTGFRAPALQELFRTDFEDPGATVTDPRRNETAPVLVRTGGNPDLEPEDSESWNVGLVLDMPGVQGLSLTFDLYRVLQHDQIASPGSASLLELEAQFSDRIRRAEPTQEDIAAGLPGRILEIDLRDLNISQARVQGVDLGLRYVRNTPVGRFDVSAGGAYIDRLTAQLTPSTPVERLEGTTHAGLAGVGSPVRFRGNAAVFWSRNAWEIGVTERYTRGPRETIRSTSPTFDQRLDDHFETDLRLNYRVGDDRGWLAGTRLSLGVENVFNSEPPFHDVALGYNGALYSPRQAFYHLTLTRAF